MDAALDRLPAGPRTVALRLLDTLRANGFLREATATLPHGLTEDELHRHAHEIAYVRHWLDSPEHHFERYRTAHVLLIGDDGLLAATRNALLACGLRRVHTESPRADHATLRAAAERADAVVYAGDGTTPAAVRAVAAVERVCGDTTPLFRALSRHDACWLLPPGVPLRAADLAHRLAHHCATPAPAPLSPAATALVGGRLALAVFRLLTGIPDEDTTEPGPVPEALRLDPHTLATDRHRILPAPAPFRPDGLGSTADFALRVKALRAAPALSADELTERLAACADGVAGPYGPPTTEYGSQIPLTVVRCALAGGGEAVGAALDPRAARDEALRRAGAAHALAAARAVDADADFFVFAERLTDGRPRLLSADRALTSAGRESAPADHAPASEAQARPHASPAAVGTACAESWDAAVEAALLDAVRALAADRAAVPDACPAVDPAGLLHHTEAARLWRLLRTLGPLPDVRDASAGLGVPVIALVAEGEVAALGCASTAAVAFADAARSLLLARQLDDDSGSVRGPVPVALPGADPAERISALAARLAAQGYAAHVVPLDQDRDFAALVPFVARVVLDDVR